MNFKVDFIFYTNFGYKKDLKNNEAYYTVKNAERRGFVNKIITIGLTDTRGLSKSYFVDGIPGGNLTARALYIINRFYKKFNARQVIEYLLDKFGSKYITGDILYIWPRLVISLNRAKEKGIATVVYGTSAHPEKYLELMVTEAKKYNINIKRSFDINMRKHVESFEISDYIFALSTFAKETYIEYGIPEEKIVTILGMGVDINRFRPSDNEHDGFNVLFVADMTILKGVLYLLKAWSELKLKDAKLYLVGLVRDSVRNVVEKYAKNDKSIVLAGKVQDPRPYYELADVFVMPSLCEGFEKVTLEAMASGLPVIATTNTGARDVVRDGKHGFIIPIRDSEAIKDKIQYFYDNPSEIRRMGKNARKVAEEYTWDRFSERIADSLELVYELHYG